MFLPPYVLTHIPLRGKWNVFNLETMFRALDDIKGLFLLFIISTMLIFCP